MKRNSIKCLIATIGVSILMGSSIAYADEVKNVENSNETVQVETQNVSKDATKSKNQNINGLQSKDVKNTSKEKEVKTSDDKAVKEQNNNTNQKNSENSNSVTTATDSTKTTTPTDTNKENTDINNAKGVNRNSIEKGQIKAAKESRWYLTYIPAGKITTYLEYTGDKMDLNLYLYGYDPNTNKLTEVVGSVYGPGQAETVSNINTKGGYYIIEVRSEGEFTDNNSFSLAILYVDKYDKNEPNDNFLYSKEVKIGDADTSESISGTIDNEIDDDWYKFTLNKDRNSVIRFTNNNNNTEYVMGVYNENLEQIGVLKQNEVLNGKLTAGTYYFRVLSNKGFDAVNPYSITFIDKDKIDNLVQSNGIPVKVEQKLSSENDEKWTKINVSETQDMYVYFTNSDNTIKYDVDIYDANYNYLGTLSQGQRLKGNFKAGAYYFKLRSENGFNSASQSTLYFVNLVNFNNRKMLSDGKDSMAGVLANNDKWGELNLSSSQKVLVSLNKTTNAKCVVEIFDENYNMLGFISSPGQYINSTFNAGKYYIRIVSLEDATLTDRYDVTTDVYDPNVLMAMTNDGKYVITTDADRNNAYINGSQTSHQVDDYDLLDSIQDHGITYTYTSTSKVKDVKIGTYKGKLCALVYVTNVQAYEHAFYYDHFTLQKTKVVAEACLIFELREDKANAHAYGVIIDE